jgi:hypothetical protein
MPKIRSGRTLLYPRPLTNKSAAYKAMKWLLAEKTNVKGTFIQQVTTDILDSFENAGQAMRQKRAFSELIRQNRINIRAAYRRFTKKGLNRKKVKNPYKKNLSKFNKNNMDSTPASVKKSLLKKVRHKKTTHKPVEINELTLKETTFKSISTDYLLKKAREFSRKELLLNLPKEAKLK